MPDARKRKPKVPHPFYNSSAWRALRPIILRRDNHRCTHCHLYVGGTRAYRIDHIVALSAAPHRALDPTNLRTLCPRCHAQSHRERGMSPSKERIDRMNFGFDDLGNPLDPKHHWLNTNYKLQTTKYKVQRNETL
jgi:5-methylcytosine-specific restriction endonuclease McrA